MAKAPRRKRIAVNERLSDKFMSLSSYIRTIDALNCYRLSSPPVGAILSDMVRPHRALRLHLDNCLEPIRAKKVLKQH